MIKPGGWQGCGNQFELVAGLRRPCDEERRAANGRGQSCSFSRVRLEESNRSARAMTVSGDNVEPWAIGSACATAVVWLGVLAHLAQARPRDGGVDGRAVGWSCVALATVTLLFCGQGLSLIHI